MVKLAQPYPITKLDKTTAWIHPDTNQEMTKEEVGIWHKDRQKDACISCAIIVISMFVSVFVWGIMLIISYI